MVHTGDWKLDANPGLGRSTDIERLKQIGDEGVRALICDSTNILRDGESPSEADVAEVLREKIAAAKGRVLVTTFASNVSRLRSVCLAARSGWAADRARRPRHGAHHGGGARMRLSRRRAGTSVAGQLRAPARAIKVLVLATGSQGEARAAMSRIVRGEHPVKLAANDLVIFSSRTIPGNEREVNAIVNALILQGADVMTDRDALVHCSGHPRRGEVAKLYQWLRPAIAVPAHGEALHLRVHAEFARELGVKQVLSAHNGDMIALGPGRAGAFPQIPHGRLYRDGDMILSENGRLFPRTPSPGRRRDHQHRLRAHRERRGRRHARRDHVRPAAENPRQPARWTKWWTAPCSRRWTRFRAPRKRTPTPPARRWSKRCASAVSNAWGKKPHVHVLAIEV